MRYTEDLAPERTTKPAASKDEGPGWFRDTLLETGGRKFLNGIGKVPCEVLFVALQPTEREIAIRRPWSSRDAEFLKKAMGKAGMDFSKCRFTYLVKHHPKKLTAAELKMCARMFREELEACSPQIVVTLGAEPLKGVVGTSYRWDDVHGSFIVPDSIENCPFRVFPTFSMSQVAPNPKWDRFLDRDMRLVADAANGIEHPLPECEDIVIHTPEEVEGFRKFLEHRVGSTAVMLDCEWHGKNWMDPDRYFRTVQIGWRKGRVVTVEVAKEGGERCYRDEPELMRSLKRLLESPNVLIAGHNIIADGEWLLSYGIDIRDRVMYDTMLAEHIIDQNGPFGLEALAMKYTPYGRYSTDVEVWVRRHKGEKLPDSTANGYGFVPRDMLLKYGYADVDVLWYIMERQWPILEERGCLKRRGVNGEYPSLLDTALRTQRCTYDLERNGLPVDMGQLDDLTERYQAARSECLSKVMKLAREAGEYDFNPRSTLHLRKMLFGTLKLTPVKTTDGDDWGDTAGEDGMDSEVDRSAATDKTTLEILSGSHPFVDALLDFRRVDQACKTWLTKEKDGQPAGLYKDLWPDGTLKPRFSTLTETGRYRTSAPNCQNYPKKAEGYISKIFGEGNEPPLIRTIVDPMSRKENQDGRKWVQLEGDFCQAEMFVAANISGDQNMLKALTTPGLDLHDKTAVDSFGLHMVDENGREVTEDDLVKMAADLKDSGGAESEEFQHFMKTLTYVEKNGNRLTRAQFKNTLRVASKAINFGTMYGRGSRAISLQIKADTGDKRSVDEIDAVTSVGLASWKKNAYPTLWNTLQGWGRLLYTQGYVENPWGMRKYGYVRDGERNASLERQFSNFPIQSTVAGTVQIAMDQMRTYILKRDLPFRMQNQIHDAVMIECPIDYVDECKKMFRETMAGIRIPLQDGRWFTLDVDIDVYERWGVKMKA